MAKIEVMSNHNLAASSFLSDQAVAARVLGHIREGTTDLGGEVWREPVANYRSPERFGRELERVLRRWPAPFCPSAALPEAGSFVAREAAGTPLLAVRGEDGEVRAFRNACRHRGTQLADGAGCARTFVCPYHGWTYRLDGRLHHVPHAHGFPDLDREQSGLVSVACEERLGLVFVTQDPGAPGADAALAGLPELIAPEQRLLATNQIEFAGELEDLPRELPRGLPHPRDAPEVVLPLRLRQPERGRELRRQQPCHLPLPPHPGARRGGARGAPGRGPARPTSTTCSRTPSSPCSRTTRTWSCSSPSRVDRTRLVSYALTNRGEARRRGLGAARRSRSSTRRERPRTSPS